MTRLFNCFERLAQLNLPARQGITHFSSSQFLAKVSPTVQVGAGDIQLEKGG